MLNLTLIRKMQIKTALRSLFFSVTRLAEFGKSDNLQCG